MQLSAEIRLFWFDHKPAALESWFMDEGVHAMRPGGGEVRTDVYLRDENQIGLGVKTRGKNSGVEVKGLVAVPGDTVRFDSYEIPIEIWTKWPSEKLGFDTNRGIVVQKRRWVRKFDTAQARIVEVPLDSKERPANGAAFPDVGCNVEWTEVEIQSVETCWTLGFESFGTLRDVENSLRSVVRMMGERNPPHAPGAMGLSYPAWIAKRLSESGKLV